MNQRIIGALLSALLIILSAVASAQVTTLPYSEANPVVSNALTAQILEAFRNADLGREAKLSVRIVHARRGTTHVDINSDVAMKPASLMKILVSAAALETFGTDERFYTNVETTGIMRDNVLLGDIIVRGGGNPSLGSRFQKTNRNDITQVFSEWADQIKAKGIRTVEGNIIGNDLRYANEPHALGWEPMEFGEWYSAEVSALCFNENTIDLIWRAGARSGQRPRVELVPDTKYITLSSSVRIGPETQENPRLRYMRFAGSNEIRARGSLPPNTEKYDFAAIHDPARFAAQIFKEALEQRGITVRGTALNQRVLGENEDDVTTQPIVLIRHPSPPLKEFLPVILGDSQNLYAEVLLREYALAKLQPPTFKGGSDAVAAWLRQNRMQRPGFVMVDGSGLSPVNRAPARIFTDVLKHMSDGKHAALFRQSLAKPGERSLLNRFSHARYAPLRENLTAKTGYLSRVHSLAGYLRNRALTDYTFVVVLNDVDDKAGPAAREFIDDLVLMIYDSEVLD